jgi:hypothetical protein
MRRIAYLLAAALSLSGCGVLTKDNLEPTAPTLTHGRFVYLGNGICARDLRFDKHFLKTPPKTHQEYDKDVRTLNKSFEHAIFDLRKLEPPPADAAAFRQLLASFNLEDLLAVHVLAAGDSGEAQRVKDIFKRSHTVDKRLRARARALGLHACAKE